MEQAYLVLEDGTVFAGTRIGASGDAVGELVFTTGMVSYLETLTDPACYGQLVVQTFPMIGNYGVMEEDFEGDFGAAGYIVRELCPSPSNFRCQYPLDELLKKRNIPGICGLDTRELTAILREKGTMNAILCSQVPEDLSFVKTYRVPTDVTPCKEPTVLPGDGSYHVGIIELGGKRSVHTALQKAGCAVTLLPMDTKDVSSFDALVISGGPGDPNEYQMLIEALSGWIGTLPIMGIGLGHELLALAQGGTCLSLHHGHRGDNQPVRDLRTGKTLVTTQNHGYHVVAESLMGVGLELFRNAYDDTCEGLEYPGKRCFSLQFDPDEQAYSRFLSMIGG